MELTENTLWLLKQAFYFSLTSVNDAVKSHGVSTAQIGVLRQLANEPGLSGAELARRLLISPQGVQLALTALEKRGLVERKQDPEHGRIRQVFLTGEGRAVAAAVVSDAIAAHDRVFGVLTPKSRSNSGPCSPASSSRAPDTPWSPTTSSRSPPSPPHCGANP